MTNQKAEEQPTAEQVTKAIEKIYRKKVRPAILEWNKDQVNRRRFK